MGALNVFGRLPRLPAPAVTRSQSRRAVEDRNNDNAVVEKRNETATPLREISFGSFRLVPTQFLLLEGDKAVPIGSRALEILTVLLERPGALISKEELIARVWPNVFVTPANLTVHMSALRRALRDGQDGNRFIINVPGRGYSLVASVNVTGPIRSDGNKNSAAFAREPEPYPPPKFNICPANPATGNWNGNDRDPSKRHVDTNPSGTAHT